MGTWVQACAVDAFVDSVGRVWEGPPCIKLAIDIKVATEKSRGPRIWS